MKIETLVVGPLEVNCYLVWDEETNQGIVIDPGAEGTMIVEEIEKRGFTLTHIVNTHCHVDHIGANADVKEAFPEALLAIPEKDLPLFRSPHNPMLVMICRAKPSPEPDLLLKEGDTIPVGSEELTVIETPGHTVGSVCLYGSGVVFTGDTLFAGSVGRTDLPFSQHDALFRSVRQKLFILPEDTEVLPGHGPPSTIGREKRFNPFFSGLIL
ncbi:MAG TPA: MBL fold metallo-hydrolase [Thermosulfidibacter takaii]|uniref:MBL fold metallo-hydrolase n=1 Tax=Thermosulfidibacter takaii TaxID=412593 RepID=A0A7C0Y5S5_9BACT|nr:MBL fold metallo-hydrolase [Thermosulfidibacter takaii]